jgi:hypothetical protein
MWLIILTTCCTANKWLDLLSPKLVPAHLSCCVTTFREASLAVYLAVTRFTKCLLTFRMTQNYFKSNSLIFSYLATNPGSDLRIPGIQFEPGCVHFRSVAPVWSVLDVCGGGWVQCLSCLCGHRDRWHVRNCGRIIVSRKKLKTRGQPFYSVASVGQDSSVGRLRAGRQRICGWIHERGNRVLFCSTWRPGDCNPVSRLRISGARPPRPSMHSWHAHGPPTFTFTVVRPSPWMSLEVVLDWLRDTAMRRRQVPCTSVRHPVVRTDNSSETVRRIRFWYSTYSTLFHVLKARIVTLDAIVLMAEFRFTFTKRVVGAWCSVQPHVIWRGLTLPV